MLEFSSGNLLTADVEALVNTVNCVGVMGKGIALQFKQAFPENTRIYEKACRNNELHPGIMLVVPTGNYVNPRYIINFPTKTHWKGKSKISYIKTGLDALVAEMGKLNIQSIAIPPLGCGNGGLSWQEVFPLIEESISKLPHVRALIFAPHRSPAAMEMPVTQKQVGMTRVRALLVKLIERYREPGYRLTLLEVQKLAYFLQAAQVDMRLRFVKHLYGPYAENLNHALMRLEGQLIRGYGDRTSKAEITLAPDAAKRADDFLHDDPEAIAKLNEVSQFIEGFESPYGLELLASLHWIAQNDIPLATDEEVAIKKLHDWNSRKRKLFKPEHIRIAWNHMRSLCGNTFPASYRH